MYKKKKRFVNLTPLIDVMTTLIIFILIQSSDSAVEINEPINLSNNQNGSSVEERNQILIGMNEIKIGEDFKIRLKEGNIDKNDLLESEDKLIRPLYEKVTQLRRESEEAEKEEDFSFNLAFDKSVPAESVKKVIFTTTMAGANNLYYLGESQ